MAHTRSGARRRASLVAVAMSLAILVAACGGSASPSPSASPAPASVAPSVEPSPSPTPSPSPSPSVTPSASASVAPAVAEDPAKGLKVGAPYALVELDPALTQYFRNQMANGMGSFAGLFSIGLRQVTGGKSAANIVLVMGFPKGMLNDQTYKGAIGGMLAVMDVTKQSKTTVSGVDVTSATVKTGTIAAFRIGDHLIMVISSGGTDAVAIATAVVSANK